MFFVTCVGSWRLDLLETRVGIRRIVNSEFVTLRQLTTAIDVLTDLSSACELQDFGRLRADSCSVPVILLSTNVLWRSRLRMPTKLALGGIISLTLFVIGVAIIRVVIAPRNEVLDLSWPVCWQGVKISVEECRGSNARVIFLPARQIAPTVVCLASFRIFYTATQQSSRAALVQPRSDDTGPRKSYGNDSSEREWTELPKVPSDTTEAD